MAFTYFDGILEYSRKANCGLYLPVKTAIFANRDNVRFTPKGKKLMVRQYSAGTAGNYSKQNGWMKDYGVGQGLEWKEYEAQRDRAKILRVDAMEEQQSYAAGMTPSIQLLMEDFMDNSMPAEIDANNIARWYQGVPAANVHESDDAGYGIGINNILETINGLEMEIFDSGYEGKSVLFISSKAYKNMRSAIISKLGLVNPNVLEKTKVDFFVDTGLSALDSKLDDKLKVSIDVEVYGRFYVIPMPSNRMYGQIDFLSGDPDDAQEAQRAGGYIKHDGADDIYLLAMPLDSGFTSIRYQMANLLFPAYVETGIDEIKLRAMNQQMFGNFEILSIGANQKSCSYEGDIRVFYDGYLYNNRARNCFAVIAGDADDPSAD